MLTLRIFKQPETDVKYFEKKESEFVDNRASAYE